MGTVRIDVTEDVFASLKRLAEPLVDDASAVIDRLIKHWEGVPPPAPGTKTINIKLPAPPTEWRSARGERFPIGTKLRATYFDNRFEAAVTVRGIEFNGKTYNNPSSAGIAAKKSAGTVGTAANTNGWEFWEMLDPTTEQWVSINSLRATRGS